jgi:SAM-dependent methyltransferase
MWRRRQPPPLPVPPPEMRDLIGGSGPERFDNPTGEPVYDCLPPDAYEAVFDFGCGCGRVARQLIQQQPRPQRYLGMDLHAGMVEWCRRELAPHAPGFEFEHHDIYNAGLNPQGEHRTLPLPAGDGEFTLFNAISVFTHSTQDQTEHYLREAARVLRPDGWLNATWFLFDKALFPMMQPFQNALFINETDPSNAVIFDRAWVRETARGLGLVITQALPPPVRGFHWQLVMRPDGIATEVDLPEDTAPVGQRPPPLTPADAERIGR